MVKITARGDTTTVDAYLTPHIKKYLESFRRGFSDLLENTNLLFMQSDGGLTSAGKFNGSNAILSGPAGGVVGYAKTCYEYFEAPVIGFDMGGTSTDVSRYGGNFELVHETTTAGVKIQAPQLNINTVAAGGGSRLFIKNGLLVVGPESSGAHPGPVCYRKGGFLSITDANLVLGRLQPEFFPKIFGSKGNEPLDREASIKEFQKLLHEVKDAYNRDFTVEEIALGFIKVANAEMIRAIKEISVMRGYDVKEHILSCFGGAGGQHACSIARQLGIKKVFIHRFSGILSAYGMGLADVVCERQEPASCVYSAETLKELTRRLDSLEKIAASELMSQGYEKKSILSVRYLNLRFKGTDTAIMIAEPNDKDYKKSFHREYIREFGFDFQNRAILVDDIRVRAISKSSISVNIKVPERKAKVKLLPKASFKCYFEQGFQETGVYFADDLLHNDQIQGPAIIIQDTSTILVEPGCSAVVSEYGDIILNIEPGINEKISKEVDPVQLSIFSNLFMSIAEQMGRTLQKTAISTNIKERLDFSCAIFDKDGDLVANAPHIPVHLGAMGEAVKSIIGIVGKDIKEGDVLVTNHPKYGGSHLPDITVITPVWSRNKIVFYVANRGHHADIGGISPGSMPPFSTSLYQEGVCIKCFKLVENGLFKERQIKEILLKPTLFNGTIISGSRNVSDNISDLKAQVAANQKGIDLLIEMIEIYGDDVVFSYMNYIQDAAENAVRERLKQFSLEQGLNKIDTVYAEDFLDDGSRIALKLTINRENGSAIFDFTGTGNELKGNLNAPYAVTTSAVVYSLRCLLKEDIPLNSGCLKPVKLIIPKGSLLNPSGSSAVVGGNVLTSQRITDVILKAFKAAAASQGCMNNFTFGNNKFGYYETIAGGAGAGDGWHGQSGVHTHMTNTRITDPEILEKRYPVMLVQFSIRDDNEGQGKYIGGRGLVREIEFLDKLNAAILSERRVYAPYGLEGGENGAKGENLFIKRTGKIINLGGKNEVSANKGDRIIIKTPGGGGYGSAVK